MYSQGTNICSAYAIAGAVTGVFNLFTTQGAGKDTVQLEG